jgi:DNA-binding transcriptional ArsR family regulator
MLRMTGRADLDLIFAALADPTRRAILRALLDGEQRVGDLAKPLPMSLAAASKHLQILGRAGLVSQLRDGRVRTCRLEPDGLSAAYLWMQGFGAFASDDFDALERMFARLLEDADLLGATGGEADEAAAEDAGGGEAGGDRGPA